MTAIDESPTQTGACASCDELRKECEFFHGQEETANKAREILAVGVRQILDQIEKRRHLAEVVQRNPELWAGRPEAQVRPVTVEEIEKSLANLSARAMRAWKGKN